jgi:hypothetical protein
VGSGVIHLVCTHRDHGPDVAELGQEEGPEEKALHALENVLEGRIPEREGPPQGARGKNLCVTRARTCRSEFRKDASKRWIRQPSSLLAFSKQVV